MTRVKTFVLCWFQKLHHSNQFIPFFWKAWTLVLSRMQLQQEYWISFFSWRISLLHGRPALAYSYGDRGLAGDVKAVIYINHCVMFWYGEEQLHHRWGLPIQEGPGSMVLRFWAFNSSSGNSSIISPTNSVTSIFTTPPGASNLEACPDNCASCHKLLSRQLYSNRCISLVAPYEAHR